MSGSEIFRHEFFENLLMHRLDDVQLDARTMMEMEFVKRHGNAVLLARLIKAGDLRRKTAKPAVVPSDDAAGANETK